MDIKQEVATILTNLVDSVVTCKYNALFLIFIFCCLSLLKHAALFWSMCNHHETSKPYVL